MTRWGLESNQRPSPSAVCGLRWCSGLHSSHKRRTSLVRFQPSDHLLMSHYSAGYLFKVGTWRCGVVTGHLTSEIRRIHFSGFAPRWFPHFFGYFLMYVECGRIVQAELLSPSSIRIHWMRMKQLSNVHVHRSSDFTVSWSILVNEPLGHLQ